MTNETARKRIHHAPQTAVVGLVVYVATLGNQILAPKSQVTEKGA